MVDRPAIPHEPRTHPCGGDKRWTRMLAERGKLTSPGKRLPLYRMKKEPKDEPA